MSSFSRIKYFFCLVLLCAGLSAGAYTERNIIGRKAVSMENIRECVVTDRSWVTYPEYGDRSGWNEFLGDSLRNVLVREGEKLLDYDWHLIKATDYLEYVRSGNISVMETPYFENRRNINILMLAELAEGKGRFIDQLRRVVALRVQAILRERNDLLRTCVDAHGAALAHFFVHNNPCHRFSS